MPTGYTATLCEKPQTFREFLFTCARAMGACIALRDEPLSSDLPDDVGFSPYHVTALEKANAEVLRLSEMTTDERLAFGRNGLVDQINQRESSIAETRATRERIANMIAEVTKWTPPTKDHTGLQTFMLDQLRQTLDFDGDCSYSERELEHLKLKRPLDVWEEALAEARRSVEYHREHMAQDDERNRARNEWVQQLKASVDAAPTQPPASDDCAAKLNQK